MTETTCIRCGCPAQGRGDGNPDARMLRRAQTGVCVECGIVEFLQKLTNTFPGATAIPVTIKTCGSATADFSLPESLRLPHIQEQMANVIRAGKSDANPDEVNWERVIEVWWIAPKEPGTLF